VPSIRRIHDMIVGGYAQVGGAALYAATPHDVGQRWYREEMRAYQSAGFAAVDTVNLRTDSLSNLTTINLTEGRNGFADFAVNLESATGADNITATLPALVSSGSLYTIQNSHSTPNSYVGRRIELFVARYLKVEGTSPLGYQVNPVADERHLPRTMRIPGVNTVWATRNNMDAINIIPSSNFSWGARPAADRHLPDFLVPIEHKHNATNSRYFNVGSLSSQEVWCDIYIPGSAPVGAYVGTLTVWQNSSALYNFPVNLQVRSYTYPNTYNVKTMLWAGHAEYRRWMWGLTNPNTYSWRHESATQLAHMIKRHRITLTDNDISGSEFFADISTYWRDKFYGTLYSEAQGYEGPGQGVGDDMLMLNFYGLPDKYKFGPVNSLNALFGPWEQWRVNSLGSREGAIYLADEPVNFTAVYSQLRHEWVGSYSVAPYSLDVVGQLASVDASWPESKKIYGAVNVWYDNLTAATSKGGIKVFMTEDVYGAVANSVDRLDSVAAWIGHVRVDSYIGAINSRVASGRDWMVYNGKRPGQGTFMFEAEPIDLWVNPLMQVKNNCPRWFYWDCVNYYNYAAGQLTSVWSTPYTFGFANPGFNNSLGYVQLSNGGYGDGVLIAPGRAFTVHSATDINYWGPIASWRLKSWRRGLQFAELAQYARTMSSGANSSTVYTLLSNVVSRTLQYRDAWEGDMASPPADHSFTRGMAEWQEHPNAYRALANSLYNLIGS
jgi:hypothetical protein